MSIENIKDIRQTIELARDFESESGEFERQLSKQAETLPDSINFGTHDNPGAASKSLETLVLRYVEHVPDFLEAIYEIAEQAGIDSDIEPFLKIAEDYFLKPPEIIDGHRGLDALMDEAYLAHRLMEELNDRFIQQCGIPLAPLDMTRANVIIHHLIGEPFANDLDNIVHYAAENLVCNKRVFNTPRFVRYVQDHAKRGWSDELKRWPCLTQDLDIELKIGTSRDSKKSVSDITVH
jgi:hypothetical protein